jgi:hypothetical protein
MNPEQGQKVTDIDFETAGVAVWPQTQVLPVTKVQVDQAPGWQNY